MSARLSFASFNLCLVFAAYGASAVPDGISVKTVRPSVLSIFIPVLSCCFVRTDFGDFLSVADRTGHVCSRNTETYLCYAKYQNQNTAQCL